MNYALVLLYLCVRVHDVETIHVSEKISRCTVQFPGHLSYCSNDNQVLLAVNARKI